MTDPLDHLDERLAALGSSPVPPLLAGSEVRARGEQRRRRQRAVLVCAAVVAAAAVGGSASLALDASRDDALRVADPTTSPTSEPTPTPTSSPTPSASPTATAAPGPSASSSPTASPRAASPAPPSASPSAQAWSPATGFLSPAAASKAEMPGWFVEDDHPPRLDPGPVVDPCDTNAYAAAPADAAERAMSSLRESGGSGLVQRVSRFADTASASAVFSELVAAFSRCPQQPADDGGSFRYAVEQTSGEDRNRTALVSAEQCAPEGCVSGYRSYVLLVQSGDGISEVYYGVSEDSTPKDMAARLLDASADALRAAAQPG